MLAYFAVESAARCSKRSEERKLLVKEIKRFHMIRKVEQHCEA